VRAGEGGKLYGSVTAQNVVDEIKRTTGLEVDRRKVELREPIRALGAHKVMVRLSSELAPQVTVNVVREDTGTMEAPVEAVVAAE
jgi:large subunit ribosomal protein L9